MSSSVHVTIQTLERLEGEAEQPDSLVANVDVVRLPFGQFLAVRVMQTEPAKVSVHTSIYVVYEGRVIRLRRLGVECYTYEKDEVI